MSFLPLAHSSKTSIELRLNFYSLASSHPSLHLGLRRICFQRCYPSKFSTDPFSPSRLFLTIPTCHFWSHLGNSYIPTHPYSPSTRQLPQKSFHNIWHMSCHISYCPESFKDFHVNKKKQIKMLFQDLQGSMFWPKTSDSGVNPNFEEPKFMWFGG